MSLSTLKPKGKNTNSQAKSGCNKDNNPKIGVRKLAEIYDCGKTQDFQHSER